MSLALATGADSPWPSLCTQVRIVNIGPPTSIHTWYEGYKLSPMKRFWLSDRMFVEDDRVVAPASIRGSNLRTDHRLLETGDARVGWIALDIGTGLTDKREVPGDGDYLIAIC